MSSYMSTAKELMHTQISISENSSVSQIISKMLDLNKSRLVITRENKPVGIVTEKDVGYFLFTEKSDKSLDRISLRQIMKELVYIESTTPVELCAKKMTEKNISSLAVGSENNLEGIFTKTDLVKFYSINLAKKYRVSDYMTDHIFTVHDTASLTRVMAKMLEHKISRIITKDQNNYPIGVISFRDFFRVSLELGVDDFTDDYTLSDHVQKGFVSPEGFGSMTIASEIMTRGIFLVKSNEDLAKACRIMIDHNVSGLGVLNEEGKISGMISKTDVTRAMTSLA
jgi:CBS domain-containing protein